MIDSEARKKQIKAQFAWRTFLVMLIPTGILTILYSSVNFFPPHPWTDIPIYTLTTLGALIVIPLVALKRYDSTLRREGLRLTP